MLWRAPTARPLLVLTIGLLTIATLTACGASSNNGVASKSAREILAATRAAAYSASSVHVNSESKLSVSKLVLDASLARAQGHTRLSLAEIAAEEIRIGDTLYIKGNPAFNMRLEGTLGLKIPSGVWLKGTAGGRLPGTALTTITKEIPVILSAPGKLTKGPTTTIDGKPAIELTQKNSLYTGTLYVATTGQPYPLVLRKNGRETGETTFTNWNQPITVDPPAKAIEITELAHTKAG